MMNTLMYDLFNEIFKTGNWGVTCCGSCCVHIVHEHS